MLFYASEWQKFFKRKPKKKKNQCLLVFGKNAGELHAQVVT